MLSKAPDPEEWAQADPQPRQSPKGNLSTTPASLRKIEQQEVGTKKE